MAGPIAPSARSSINNAGAQALRRALLGSVAGFAISAGAAPAFAQYVTPTPSPAAPSAPAGDAGPTQLPVIAVQGQSGTEYNATQPTLPKLTEPLIDTPQSIDVVPRQVMDDQGVTNFRDALRNVPGISLAAGEAASQGDTLTIRGFTARNDIYLDGMRDFGSYYRDPFFMEDIQVLKGPASILFGKGSTGGVVEQDSKLPKLDSFITGTAAFGTDNTHRLTTDVNEALPSWGEGAAIRLNAMVHENQITDRDVGKNQRFGLAPSLALGLGTPTRIYLTYLHQQEYDIPDYGLPWLYQAPATAGNTTIRPTPLSQTQSKYYGFSNGSNYLRTTADVPTFKMEHDVNNAITISDQFRYARYSRAFDITEPQFYNPAALGASGVQSLISPSTPLSSLIVSRNQLAGHSIETFLENQADATMRFRTGDIEHTFRTGIEIGRETSNPTRYTTIGPFSTTPLLSPNPGDPDNAHTYLSSATAVTGVTAAGYFLDTIKLNEQWELMGGLRYDRFTADYRQATFPNPVTGVTSTAATAFKPLNYFLNWRAAVVYKPLPNGSIYADAGTSSDPSAEALALSAATGALPPVENQSYEVGTKWELFDARISVNAALFYTNQKNVSEPDPNNPLVNILAGDAYAEGGEFQAAGKITDNWQFLTGYAYTYGAIDKTTRTGPASDLNHRLANTPAHTFNLWTTYQLPWWKVQIGGGINVVGSRYASTTPTTVTSGANTVNFWKELPGYYTLQAMVKYPLTEQVALQLNLYNLTDNKFYDQIHPSHVVPGGGRTALFTLSYKL